MILSEFGLGVTKEELIDIYEYATKKRFSPLIIDMEESPDKRFLRGFLVDTSISYKSRKVENWCILHTCHFCVFHKKGETGMLCFSL